MLGPLRNFCIAYGLLAALAWIVIDIEWSFSLPTLVVWLGLAGMAFLRGRIALVAAVSLLGSMAWLHLQAEERLWDHGVFSLGCQWGLLISSGLCGMMAIYWEPFPQRKPLSPIEPNEHRYIEPIAKR